MFYIVLFFILLPCSLNAQRFVFKYQNKKRSYIVHLPAGYQEGRKYPLIFSFHGLGAYPKQQERYTGMDIVADEEGFIVVYPRGFKRVWNTGLGFGDYTNGTDDVGFINALLDTLSARYSIDSLRVYATGMSMGGFFSFRLACEMGHRMTAVAPVAALTSNSTSSQCTQTSPVPLLLIYGTNDPIVKSKGKKSYLGIDQTVNFWINNNHCSLKADTVFIPDTCLRDKSSVVLLKYSPLSGNAPFWFYKIRNGGHTWPDGSVNFWFFGATNADINASRKIWEFFKQFPESK